MDTRSQHLLDPISISSIQESPPNPGQLPSSCSWDPKSHPSYMAVATLTKAVIHGPVKQGSCCLNCHSGPVLTPLGLWNKTLCEHRGRPSSQCGQQHNRLFLLCASVGLREMNPRPPAPKLSKCWETPDFAISSGWGGFCSPSDQGEGLRACYSEAMRHHQLLTSGADSSVFSAEAARC